MARGRPTSSVGATSRRPRSSEGSAGSLRRHRLRRDEPERLVDRGDDAEVGDRVEGVARGHQSRPSPVARAARVGLAAPPPCVPEPATRKRVPGTRSISPSHRLRARCGSPSRRRAARSAARASRPARRTRSAGARARGVGRLQVLGVDPVGDDADAETPKVSGDLLAHVERARDQRGRGGVIQRSTPWMLGWGCFSTQPWWRPCSVAWSREAASEVVVPRRRASRGRGRGRIRSGSQSELPAAALSATATRDELGDVVAGEELALGHPPGEVFSLVEMRAVPLGEPGLCRGPRLANLTLGRHELEPGVVAHTRRSIRDGSCRRRAG